MSADGFGGRNSFAPSSQATLEDDQIFLHHQEREIAELAIKTGRRGGDVGCGF